MTETKPLSETKAPHTPPNAAAHTDKSAPKDAGKEAAANTAEAQLAKSKALNADILAQQVEREKWMPTPTQEENDLAAMGQPVEKKPDGSPVEETAEQQQKRQLEARKEKTRHMEAEKPHGAGYQTRSTG